MKVGATTFSFLNDETCESYGEKLRLTGLKEVELLASAPDIDLTDNGIGRSVQRVQTMMAQSGVRVITANPIGMDANLASPEAAFRQHSLNHFRRVLRLASGLECDRIFVLPGRLHAFKPVEKELAWEWLVSGLETICREAHDVGIGVVLENIPSGVVETGNELVRIIEAVDAENLRACYDVSNGYMSEDPAQGIRDAAAALEVVHLSDCTREVWRHDPIGEGDIDFNQAITALNQIGYTGVCVLETLHTGDYVAGVRQDIKRLEAAGLNLN